MYDASRQMSARDLHQSEHTASVYLGELSEDSLPRCEAAAETAWRDADALVELADKSAFVTKSASQRDFDQTIVGFAQSPASSQNARSDQEFVRSDAKGNLEPSLNLSWRKASASSQFVNADLLRVVSLDVVDGFRDAAERPQQFRAGLVALEKTHDANDLAAMVTNRQFVDDIPLGHTRLIEPQFDTVQERAASVENLCVIFHVAFGHLRRIQIEISEAHDLGLFVETVKIQNAATGEHHFAFEVLGEEMQAGQEIEQLVKEITRIDSAQPEIPLLERNAPSLRREWLGRVPPLSGAGD
jgi:hypothetical protein